MEFNVIVFADKCSIGDIGIQGIGWAQGPFCSVQLFGDWTPNTMVCSGFTTTVP
jgi:hypothetical protein